MDFPVSVKMKAPAMVRCGFPWERLLLYPWSRIEPQKPQRLTYETPEADSLQETALVEFLWADKLLLDEESGANSKLGFYFLYCLKNGILSTKLFGEDVCGTLGQLLSRWFHLRHARWGRETKVDGETSMRPSWCSTVLQLLDLVPSAGWPDAVTEARVQYRMRQGVGLTESTGEGRLQTTPHVLVQFYQSVNEVARRVFERHEAVMRHRERIQLSQSHTAMDREMYVCMADHLQPRAIPANTSMEQLQLSFNSLHATTQGAWVRPEEEEARHKLPGALKMRERLTALFGAPLSEVEMLSSFIRSETISMRTEESGFHPDAFTRSGGRTRLPFDLHQHAQCSTPLAKHLLSRLEEDADLFAQQQRQQVHYSLSFLTRDRLRLILCDNCMSAVQEALMTSTEELQK
ncbi:NXN protein, partial [Trypanosoma cruzi]